MDELKREEYKRMRQYKAPTYTREPETRSSGQSGSYWSVNAMRWDAVEARCNAHLYLTWRIVERAGEGREVHSTYSNV